MLTSSNKNDIINLSTGHDFFMSKKSKAVSRVERLNRVSVDNLKTAYFIGGSMPSGVYFRTEKMKKQMMINLQEKNNNKNPWNKGKTGVYSKETLKKMSEVKKGNTWKKGKKTGGKHQIGIKNPYWKGGKVLIGEYFYVLQPNHPFCINSGYVKQSRLIMEKHIGRYLTLEEVIHHKGIKYFINSVENKKDDRIENLQLFSTTGKHTKFHNALRKEQKTQKEKFIMKKIKKERG